MLRALSSMQRYHTCNVSIGRTTLNAYIADSGIKKMLGLMFWDHIGKKECMLFRFGRMSRQGIWMLNMHMSIDVMWLDDKFKIVDCAEALQPCGSIWNCRTYYPKADAMYVIETASGFVKSNKVKVGMHALVGKTRKRTISPR